MQASRRIFGIVLALILLTSLAACGSGGSKPGSAPGGDGQNAQAEKKPVTLNVWSGYPELEAYFKKVAAEYQKANTNVTVNVLTHPLADYQKKLAATIPAGAAADVLETPHSTMNRYIAPGLMAEAPAKVQEFVMGKAYNKEFQETVSVNGKVYGVPLFRGQGVLYYNTKMFKEAGLTAPPRTMEELMEYSRKLTKRDANGKITVSGFSLRLAGLPAGVTQKFGTLLYNFGGNILKRTGDNKWVPDYDNEAGRKAVQMYMDFLFKDKVDDPALKHDAEAFELEQTAMFIRESWVIADIAKKAPGLQYATAPMPTGTIFLPSNLYVPKSSKNQDVAWDFILFAQKPEYLLFLMEDSGWLPNRVDVDYSQVSQKIPGYKGFLDKPAGFTMYTEPDLPVYDEIASKLGGRLAQFFTKAENNTPEAIDKLLKEAAVETRAILQANNLLGK
ncbi:MAG TPA: sugar ABC transporter substrate-binding protein [Symbiobacteriaceae bacterium]|nr:sugar ABC transporter substrate-binding protein [Symbiobacteriaceae bacterium]